MPTRAFAVVLFALLSGCYKYVAVETSAPPPGSRTHVVLSDAGTVEMARWLGPSTRVIEGDVISAAEPGSRSRFGAWNAGTETKSSGRART